MTELISDGRGSPRIAEILAESWELHKYKSSQYGSSTDPLDNLHHSEPYPNHVAAIIELGNIRTRIINLVRQMEAGQDVGRKLRNAFMDNSAFSNLATVLLEEEGLMRKLTLEELLEA